MADIKYVPFFVSFDQVARNLPDKERLAMYDAVCDFGFRGVYPDFADKEAYPDVERPEMLNNLWLLICPNIEATLKKMLAGSKGGRTKKS